MKPYKNFLMDMDGVLVRGRTPVPGSVAFIEQLNATGTEYLVNVDASGAVTGHIPFIAGPPPAG